MQGSNERQLQRTSSTQHNRQIAESCKPSDAFNVPLRPKAEGGEGSQAFDILLVEDNLVNQKVLSKQLQNAGCVVHVANHGQEALEFLEKSCLWSGNPGGHAVDIVLMDLEMPVMDGLTCARRIRELQSQSMLVTHVPVIAVTANARKEQIEVSIAAGMVSSCSVAIHIRRALE